MKQRFPQPGAGGDKRDVAASEGFAFLQRMQFVGLKQRHRVGHRLEVVEQPEASNANRVGDSMRVDLPRDVGQLRGVAEHRSRHAEAGGVDRVGADVLDGEQLLEHGAEIVAFNPLFEATIAQLPEVIRQQEEIAERIAYGAADESRRGVVAS